MKQILPDWLSVQRRDLIKCLASGVVFCAAYTLLMHRRAGTGMTADSLFLYGLLMLVMGCWYIVRRLGLFDYTAYGFKRFLHGLTMQVGDEREDPLRTMDYYEYLKIKRVPSSGAPFVSAVLYIGVYILLVYVF